MSALRQHEYDIYLDAPGQGAPRKQTKGTKKRKSKFREFIGMAFERLVVFILIVTVILSAVAGCSYILKRYVDIHRTQGEIFTLKQDIKRLDKKKDELLIHKESEMTLQELEDYAVDYLDMIKASEGYKVVVSKSYNVVGNDLIESDRKSISNLEKPTDDPLIALGSWIKRMTSY